MANFSIKKLVLVIITGIVGIFGFIAPVFSLVEYSVNKILIQDTGYSLMSFSSKFLPEGDAMVIISGILSYIILIFSALSIVFTILSIFKEDDMPKIKRALIFGNLATLIYLIIGIIDLITYRNWFNGNELNYFSEFFKTKAFIAFIVTEALTIGYIICLKVIPGEIKSGAISQNEYGKMKEEQRISLMIKYKELLKEEIITEEEFLTKKREILFLDNKKDEPKKEKVEVKKSQPKGADDTKMQKMKEYKKMFDDGIISKEEFAELKKKLL